MTKEEISSIVGRSSKATPTAFRFSLKKRNEIQGYFVNTGDYLHLNSKNYWYILKAENRDEWLETQNQDLLLLFPGDVFSRIQAVNIAD
ncbi:MULTISPECIES: hypothetical protein [Chitinophagaceae]